jgi:hypothetical protein
VPSLRVALQEIESAGTPQAVLEIVRRFLDELSIDDRTELPWGLAPELLETPADLALWALHLERGEGDQKVGPAYGRATKLLKEACDRFAALRATAAESLGQCADSPE